MFGGCQPPDDCASRRAPRRLPGAKDVASDDERHRLACPIHNTRTLERWTSPPGGDPPRPTLILAGRIARAVCTGPPTLCPNCGIEPAEIGAPYCLHRQHFARPWVALRDG